MGGVQLRESFRRKLPKLATLIIIPSASYRLKPIISLHTKNSPKYIIWQPTPTNSPLSIFLKTVSTSVFRPVSCLLLVTVMGLCVNLTGAGRCRVCCLTCSPEPHRRLVCKEIIQDLFSEKQTLGSSVFLSLHSSNGQLHKCLSNFRAVLLFGSPGLNLSLQAEMPDCGFKTH